MQLSKPDLRTWADARRNALLPAQRAAASRRISERIIAHPDFLTAPTLLVYAAMRSEVETSALMDAALAAGKVLAYPSIDWASKSIRPTRLRHPDRLTPGRFGVPEPPPDEREPIEIGELALVLVPGLCFDLAGHRLGYGAGMFDRLLADLAPACLTWGLAYEEQIVGALPNEAHDRPVDAVITEARWIARETYLG